MRFGIGSNTKLFIATVLLKLQEEGLLSLDDSLNHWLPSYPYVDSSITIRQMLAHQSGLFDYFNDNISLLIDSTYADTSRFWTPEEIMATIGAPHFAPGQGWSYSNTNYLLAGEIIDTASGYSWVENLHDIIFDPLEMDSIFVGAYEPRNGPVAAEWDGFTGEVIVNSPMTSEYSMMHAAGGILSGAQEMVSWYNSLLNGEIISNMSLNEMLDFEPVWYYGLGIWASQYNGKLAYTHTGGTLGYISMMWYDVETKTILCILYNGRDAVGSQFSALLDVLYDYFPEKENDAGISEIITPWSNVCSGSIHPMIILKNHGNNPLSSVDISYFVDEDPVSIANWTGALDAGDTVHIPLDEIAIADGHHTFTCYTSLPNGAEEGYFFNDTARSNFMVNTMTTITAPFEEGFEGENFPPDGWSLGSNSLFHWRSNDLTAYEGEGSTMKNNYQDISIGATYDMDLPIIDLTGGINPALYFAYAYARFPGNNFDSLKVCISTDCGNSWDVLFEKGGVSLSTAAPTYDPFYPKTINNWRTETIPLDDHQGEALIRFQAICGAGNNLYVDNVAVVYTTGSQELTAGTTFSVFPNPTMDWLNVTGLPVGLEIDLTDIAGKTLYQCITKDIDLMIDLSSLPRGIYILHTTSGSKKVVKW
jgi:CubicO group peptidase (beta-lactamase class C family)